MSWIHLSPFYLPNKLMSESKQRNKEEENLSRLITIKFQTFLIKNIMGLLTKLIKNFRNTNT